MFHRVMTCDTKEDKSEFMETLLERLETSSHDDLWTQAVMIYISIELFFEKS